MENINSDRNESGEIIPGILNGIYRYSPLAILLLKDNGNIIGCNRSTEILFGYKEREIEGSFNPLILPDDRYEYLSQLMQVKSGKKIENLKVIRQKKNGERIKLIYDSFPLINSSGKTEAIAEFYKQEFQASDTLINKKEYQDFSEASVSKTNDLLYSLDNNLNVSFISVNAKNYITEEQYNTILSRNISSVPGILGLEPDIFEKLCRTVELAIKEKREEFHETADITFNNKEINFIISGKLYFTESGEFTGIRGIIRDNTLVKELEYEIADKIHGINFLTKNLNNIIFYTIIDSNISILKTNIFGFESERFRSQPKLLRDIVLSEDIDEYERNFNKWLNSGMKDILDLEYRIRDKEGKIVWIEEHIIFDYDSKGRSRITGLIMDISERKENEIKLRDTKNIVEESNLIKSTLLRNLSHELRTPISNILGLTEIISEELSDENIKSKIALINRAGLKLIFIIKSINNLSLLEEKKLESKAERTGILHIIEKLINEYKQESGYKEIYLNYIKDKDYFAITDVKFLQIILSNIFDSIIYSLNNGRIDVYLEQINDTDNKYCEIRIVHKGSKSFEKSFKDNIQNIFNGLIENSNDFDLKYDSTDIGLLVAKKMTDMMQGVVEIRDVDNRSSAFIIKLPSETGYRIKKSDISAISEKEKTLLPEVLLVEDNLTNKVITTAFLRNVCNIDHAANGKAAVMLTEKKHYDLILMDINLGPGLNGIETLKKIREKDTYKNIPIIAVTGYAMHGDEERLLKSGFDDYISKPFKKEQLISLVKKNISDKKSKRTEDSGKREIDLIINSFAYAFFTVSSDFKIQYVNETAKSRIKNIHTGESIKTDTDFFDYVVNKDALRSILDIILSGKSTSTREKIVYCNSNYDSDFEIFNPVFNEFNEIAGFSYTGICTEKLIGTGEGAGTAVKEIKPETGIRQDKFNYSTENLTTALQLANIGVWIWDSAKDKYYWSEKFYEIIGVSNSPDEFKISDFASYIHPDDLRKVLTAIKSIVTEGSYTDIEFRYLKNRENLSYGRLIAKYIKNYNGSTGKLVSIISDITDIIEYKLNLEKKTKELEHINLRKDKFLSMVAHDLRSPFTGLLGLAEILSTNSDTLSKEDVKEISNQIHQSSKQIFNLLENLLEWSRIQRGKINYVKVDLNIKTLIDKIINLYHHNANQKNLTIINRIGGNVMINADLYMTELIFRNLLSNAVKFSKFGGYIYFDHARVGNYDQITVTDTGIGISEENIKKLMQIDQNYTSKGTGGETGTGLGLILCKEHLDKNGGKIEVVSELGKGSSFIVSFPKSE